MVLYFLRLGALGFGGPVALAQHMRTDLIERRGWFDEAEYEDGLALATACPGPLAFQLGVYFGYLRAGAIGAGAVAVAFACAPFLIATAISAIYVHFAGVTLLRAAFYGVAPVVLAMIVKATWKLGGKTLRRNPDAWALALIVASCTAVSGKELMPLFIAAGLWGMLRMRPRRQAVSPVSEDRAGSGALLPLALPASLSVATGAASLFWFFLKTGFLVFGSGLVIAPFLQAYVVEQYHWLDSRQFVDAVAVGMVTPGPVVITATFVGYLVDGLGGAAAATVGIFLPALIFVVVLTPWLRRHRGNVWVKGFVSGITAGVVGALAGTTLLVGVEALPDAIAVMLTGLALLIVMRWNAVPDVLLALGGAAIGIALRGGWL
ncbi:MAG: chromate efflux transporter [Xanthomonadaceae bacterium]|nr:chromate efflux transporter [Xanthomonadaceae bacterium]